MRGLHRLVDDREQPLPHLLQLHLIAHGRAEGGQRPLGVDRAPVEAPVDRRLDATAKWCDQRGDQQGGGDDDHRLLPCLPCLPRLPRLPRLCRLRGERLQHRLRREHEGDIDRRQRRRERAVDQRETDEDVDVEEAVAQDGQAGDDRQADARGVIAHIQRQHEERDGQVQHVTHEPA